MRFVAEVITTDGGRPDFLEASCSSIGFSAPAVSVSVSLVLKGAKKFRVITGFIGTLTVADFGNNTVDFLAVCEVSSK
jgi:hypothetical protein